ncbi:CU044_2847 family protein [Candidatus Thiothrix anitrata]|uniref:Trypsin-co-occurring domain-containing protein n=1 Tax=Candidatus Thiothrix anitrata TaxID=2823902 RepID=A0ABX7X0T2_9GAMM|nr:CU044_2847 family protein [Candidatus Thiothrix anitrata]QTR49522.1 hypothetical protein J8380_14975 [Candidatus Thiothrix anitrata]
MSQRKISPVEINGKTIWIEVEDIDITQPIVTPRDNRPSDLLDDDAAPVGPISDYFKDKVSSVADTLEAVVGSIDKGISKISPDEWSIEVNIGFAGEHNIPFLAKSSVNGGVKVNAKWKKAMPKPTDTTA